MASAGGWGMMAGVSMPDEVASEDVAIRDVEGFRAVFDEHWLPVVRYCSRRLGIDAGEQVAADVFAEAFAGRARFDPRRGSVRAWLFGIASHLVARAWRDEQRRWRLLGETPRDGTVAEPELDGLDRRIVRALSDLSAVDRDALLLVAWGDLTYAEVAQVQQVPVGTVRSRIHRARRLLATRLAEAEVG
jgi:RNA polymerase sigma factor (sigma-70 family)